MHEECEGLCSGIRCVWMITEWRWAQVSQLVAYPLARLASWCNLYNASPWDLSICNHVLREDSKEEILNWTETNKTHTRANSLSAVFTLHCMLDDRITVSGPVIESCHKI